MNAAEQRALLERAAAAMGFDTTHSMNAVRMTLEPPCAALLIRRKQSDGELKLVSTGWNPLDASTCTGPAEAMEIAAHFRLFTGFDKRLKQFGECAYASYRSGRHNGIQCINNKMVSVREAGGPVQAMCHAIVGAAIAQHEAQA